MVAGCSMGAGSLALPILAAGPNFIFSTIGLICMGILSYSVAKISLEIFLVYKNEANGSTIAQANFGTLGVVIFGLLNILLMYALLSVYMSGGVDILDKTVFPVFQLPASSNFTMLLLLLCAAPIFLKGAEVVVKSNKIVFIIKLFCFLGALIIGIKFIAPNIVDFVLQDLRYLPKALPIFFSALWFHFLIPVIARLNNYNRLRCQQIFVWGITLPVILYILWTGVMLSLIPRIGEGNTFYSLIANNSSVGTMINYATNNNQHLPNLMKVMINGFANVAMLTSFLSVGISTYDYIRNTFQIKQTRRGIFLNFIFTMLPPAFFSLVYPNGFVFILQQAAILLMLINIFTLFCCIKAYTFLEGNIRKINIYTCIVILAGLIGLQVADNINLLPNFGIN